MRRIAFLDFDGTITTRDTLLEFIQFSRGRSYFYTGFLLCSPWLVAFKLGLISNQSAKERVLQFFFGGMTEEQFNDFCDQFNRERLPSLIRPKAAIELLSLARRSFDIVIVSASPANWIGPWAKTQHYQFISTVLEVKNGRITGKISGKNCHGGEKVERIRAQFDLAAYDEILAYGDSSGDLPMLNLAGRAFFKPFR